MRIAISSGHGKHIRGARGQPVPPQLDEVDEARHVVDRVWELLADVGCVKFHDDVSTTQSENLDRIVSWHNDQDRTLDVSVHFNCYDHSANGTEVLYVTQGDLADEVSEAIALAGGFTNRGAKYRDDLAFLNGTDEPAILIEVCFCDHTGDSERYRQNFEQICHAIAETITGSDVGWRPPGHGRPPIEQPELPGDALFYARGTCSWFGGPDDDGVSPSEGLAFFYQPSECPHLMLPYQPSGTTGMARRLDPGVMYVACRWDYDKTPKEMLRDQTRKALVRAKGWEILAYPADWGPHEQETGRAADLSPALMEALDLSTDDEVEVIYPAEAA
jgi:N-acetylmuramoyl-L-alanine amidase